METQQIEESPGFDRNPATLMNEDEIHASGRSWELKLLLLHIVKDKPTPKKCQAFCLCGACFGKKNWRQSSLWGLFNHLKVNDNRMKHICVKPMKSNKKQKRRLSIPRWAGKRLPRKGRRERFLCLYRSSGVAVAQDQLRGTIRLMWKFPNLREEAKVVEE